MHNNTVVHASVLLGHDVIGTAIYLNKHLIYLHDGQLPLPVQHQLAAMYRLLASLGGCSFQSFTEALPGTQGDGFSFLALDSAVKAHLSLGIGFCAVAPISKNDIVISKSANGLISLDSSNGA